MSTPAPPPEPQVVVTDTRRNPWPRVVLICAALASLATCMVAAQYAPGAKPLRPVATAPHAKPAPRATRKRHAPAPQVVLLPSVPATVDPESVVTLDHEAVNGQRPLVAE